MPWEVVLGTHMWCQLWGPNTDISVGDHIQLEVLGTTCHGNSWYHVRLHFCYPQGMANLWTTCHDISRDNISWQFWGTHAIAFLGSTCDGSNGDHIKVTGLGKICNCSTWTYMRWNLKDPHTDGSSGEHVQSQFWGPHALLFLVTAYDGSSGDNMRYRLWGSRRILV